MSSEIALDDMWDALENYGIDRRLLESTNPSNELIFRLYSAIKQVKEKSDLLEKENTQFRNEPTAL